MAKDNPAPADKADKTAEKGPEKGGEKSGAPAKPAKAKKGKKVDARALAHVKATFNNTLVTITTYSGEVISVGSAGIVGFKGTRKSTPFAAQRAAEQAASVAMRYGVREVEVKVKGAGSGRESAVRALSNTGLKVLTLEDVTPLPHNGCRARKRRRV
ncbi:MAG: 30S ribosomal protein S11 [Planctomycetes bacterium]|nr:30S ribosomal protein S11 [Planctomycetota bacterium]